MAWCPTSPPTAPINGSEKGESPPWPWEIVQEMLDQVLVPERYQVVPAMRDQGLVPYAVTYSAVISAGAKGRQGR